MPKMTPLTPRASAWQPVKLAKITSGTWPGGRFGATVQAGIGLERGFLSGKWTGRVTLSRLVAKWDPWVENWKSQAALSGRLDLGENGGNGQSTDRRGRVAGLGASGHGE